MSKNTRSRPPATWTSRPFAALYDRHMPRWRHEPETLMRADCCLADEAVWNAHREAKSALIAEIARLGVRFDPERPILCFARRMTAYKRPDLLFTDLERLRALARRRPFQLVVAGKAHPRDAPGKELIRSVHAHLRALAPGHDFDPRRFRPNVVVDAPGTGTIERSWIGRHARVVEFGSGSGEKTRILLGLADDVCEYVPIDISGTQLRAFARGLTDALPWLRVRPVMLPAFSG